MRVRGVNHTFGSGDATSQVLFDNNLEVMPGELVIMSGPSGSGKTTILTLIGGLRGVQSGDIEIWDGLAGSYRSLRGSSDADLVKSGLAPMVADARAELEKRIASATRQLGPLGIAAADLRVLVIGKLDPPK